MISVVLLGHCTSRPGQPEPTRSASALVVGRNSGKPRLNYVCDLGLETWYLDSASSWLLTNCSKMLFDFRHCSNSEKIVRADSNETPNRGFGSLTLKFSESEYVLLVADVALVPDTGYNLISLGKLDKLGNEFKVGGDRIEMLGTDLDFILEDM